MAHDKSMQLNIRISPKYKRMLTQASEDLNSSISEIMLQATNGLLASYYAKFAEGIADIPKQEKLSPADIDKVNEAKGLAVEKSKYFVHEFEAFERKADMYKEIEKAGAFMKGIKQKQTA